MATYPEHWLFTFGGTILGGKEIWQNSIRFSDESIGSFDFQNEQQVLSEFMVDLRARFGQNYATGGGLGYSSACWLAWGKFNKIASNGRYADTENTVVEDIQGIAGMGTPGTYSPQLACAVSWMTRKTRGLASSGRIYIPVPAVAAGTDGHLPSTARGQLATNWAAFLSELNNEPGLDTTTLKASVVSGVDTNGRSGAKEFITGVRVGSVLDTQRSRRNQLVELYTETGVPA